MIIRVTALVLALIIVAPTYANEIVRTIDWDNLLPDVAPLDNPFMTLTSEQLMDLEIFVGVTDLQSGGNSSDVDETREIRIELRQKMERQGLDVDQLVAAYLSLEGELARRNQLTNAELDNKIVRIPGYALPLEHNDKGVKELLLVPYVGACIHVPPPPANQTVYVSLKDAHTIKSIYEPVWVTGRMKVESMNKSLSFVDGSADVDTAYTLDGVKIESYEE
ncbi:MAG: hypothetical protein CMF69_06025 [Magnetovibrio sp.]|nr:hypothetical protein [Magnetovibrio sp.]|tara:strand:+ start:595 stop:1257 length:663 start_codon:yes stop_codon:yes gene_type:complete